MYKISKFKNTTLQGSFFLEAFMFKRFMLKLTGVAFSVLFIVLCLNVNYVALFEMPNNIHITLEDLDDFNESKVFGNLVDAELNENIFSVGGEQRRNTNLALKLFGVIPIKQINVVVAESREVYLGGIPLGFSINTKGLIVVGKNKILGQKGSKNPFQTGDIIVEINNIVIEEASDITKILGGPLSDEISIKIKRNGQDKEIIAVPQYDESTNEYKLGLWVRDDAQGIGTLTFVTKDGKFGALGHSICDYETGVEIPVKDGGIYECNLVGINKAEKRKTGELRCLFSQSKNSIGDINLNSRSGVFGETENIDELVDINKTATIGSRMLVKLGKAKIVSSVSGIREEYDIEIIKTKYQPKSCDKSFVFRVIDKRLINLTGGIVQGMSGSPIIQDGRIIGAITHVFLNDATKGYGIYLDWMLEEVEMLQ